METATYRDGFTSGGPSAKVTFRPVGRAHTSSLEGDMERKDYNASLISRDADGKVVSTSIGYVEDGTIYAAAGFWSHTNWTPEYDAAYRSSRFSIVASIEILMDGGAAYKNKLRGLALPPTYAAG